MTMMNSTSDFFHEDPWESIDQPCYPDGRRLYLNDERFWVSKDDGNALLFFVQDKGGDSIKALSNLDSLAVSISEWGGGEFRLVCRLTAMDDETKQKFATVAKDVAFHCSEYGGAQLFRKVQERIRSWAAFLKPTRTGLSNREFIGFFGELYVLSEYILPDLQSSDALRAWIGPEGKKQDFTWAQVALEIKTSTSGDAGTVRITSLDQLDRITDYLFLVRVVISPCEAASGHSLSTLYHRCLDAVRDDIASESMFLQKAGVTYNRASQTQINASYEIVTVSSYEVRNDFPKLTRGELKPAIREARYDIALPALERFEVKESVGDLVKNG